MGKTLSNLDYAAQPGGRLLEQAACEPYEERMRRDLRWALTESSIFFEGMGRVQESLRKIAARLHDLGISYAVAGGMAMFFQGFQRYTSDVDILVTRSALQMIHEKLEGLGYVPPFTGSKHLRDAETGVKIEFLVTGDYPGDGKPKPVSFPDPAQVGVTIDGISYLAVPTLVELKLASGLTNKDRIKDLADVQELIKALDLPLEFGEKLDPFVRDEYARLWRYTRPATRFLLVVPGQPNNFDELIAGSPAEAGKFKDMQADGVTLEKRAGRVYLLATDPDVARKYDMHQESEFLDN